MSVVGRSYMITGANSGIGKATAMAIAKKGFKLKKRSLYNDVITKVTKINNVFCFVFTGGTVHMVCRNKDRAEEAKSQIVFESGNAVGDIDLNLPLFQIVNQVIKSN